MTVFSSNFSAFKTKPESRCGRSPTVVRITRSHDRRGATRLTSGRAGLAAANASGAGTGGRVAAVVFRTAHPEAKPAAVVTPANWRKSRRLMTILESARRSTVTNRAPYRHRFWQNVDRLYGETSSQGAAPVFQNLGLNYSFRIAEIVTALLAASLSVGAQQADRARFHLQDASVADIQRDRK